VCVCLSVKCDNLCIVTHHDGGRTGGVSGVGPKVRGGIVSVGVCVKCNSLCSVTLKMD
jgi:hypothetical protein